MRFGLKKKKKKRGMKEKKKKGKERGREKGFNEWSSQEGCTGVSYVSDSERSAVTFGPNKKASKSSPHFIMLLLPAISSKYFLYLIQKPQM